MHLQRLVPCSAVAVLLTLSGCKHKKPEAPTTPAAVSAAPAAPSAPAAAPVDDSADAVALAAKKHAIALSMRDQAFKDDPKGQWATTAEASSTTESRAEHPADYYYMPSKATGAPDTEEPGQSTSSWQPKSGSKSIEWLEVGFGKPVNATGLRLRVNGGSGAVIKVELIDDGGTKHTIWEGIETEKYADNEISWFERTFDSTPYKVKGARVTFASGAVREVLSVDAVQLIGE